jgi:hypothetical protein
MGKLFNQSWLNESGIRPRNTLKHAKNFKINKLFYSVSFSRSFAYFVGKKAFQAEQIRNSHEQFFPVMYKLIRNTAKTKAGYFM